jgi:hypothetical protein
MLLARPARPWGAEGPHEKGRCLMVSELVLLTLMGVAGIAIAGCIGGVLTARPAPRGKASKDTGPAPDGAVPRPS